MINKNDIEELENACIQMRLDALYMAKEAVYSHIGGALSLIEILAVLYLNIMNIDSNKPLDENRDRFILSKGHATQALYPALCLKGFIDKEELYTYKKDNTRLYAHPSKNLAMGIEFSSGSLGQGVSQAVGVALALKHKKNFNSKVYVVIGDGECDEGSVWEAVMSASHFKLDNLCIIVDKNNLQYDGATNDILNLNSLLNKFSAFGCETFEVDGHDIVELINVFNEKTTNAKVVIANTVKGKGVSFMENMQNWHHDRLTENLYNDAIKEVLND